MIIERKDWLPIRPGLEELFLATFGRAVGNGYLDWRYFQNGQNPLLFNVEIDHSEPVASYSVFPVDLICDDMIYGSAMSMTTMTHPSWRGKGLFQKLASTLYDEAQTQKIAAVWGFPNTTSHPLFIDKLDWSDIYEIPTMTLDLDAIDARILRSDAVVGKDDRFCLRYPDSPKDGLIRVNRCREYLEWRYSKNPINTYQNYVLSSDGNVSSYVITKTFRDGIDLVDIQVSSPEEAHALLSHIVKLSYENRVKYIFCWAPTHHSVHGVLERLGFRNSTPVTYFGGRELIAGGMPTGWLDNRNWYIQMGDSDVY